MMDVHTYVCTMYVYLLYSGTETDNSYCSRVRLLPLYVYRMCSPTKNPL